MSNSWIVIFASIASLQFQVAYACDTVDRQKATLEIQANEQPFRVELRLQGDEYLFQNEEIIRCSVRTELFDSAPSIIEVAILWDQGYLTVFDVEFWGRETVKLSLVDPRRSGVEKYGANAIAYWDFARLLFSELDATSIRQASAIEVLSDRTSLAVKPKHEILESLIADLESQELDGTLQAHERTQVLERLKCRFSVFRFLRYRGEAAVERFGLTGAIRMTEQLIHSLQTSEKIFGNSKQACAKKYSTEEGIRLLEADLEYLLTFR